MKNIFKNIVIWILTKEAQLLISRAKPTIIAVTGSVGKTSTKDAIYTVLKKFKRARKSQKSFNSEIGVPLSILGLPNGWDNPLIWIKNIMEGLYIALSSKDYPEVLVLEAGVDRPGDMAKLASWLKPNIVVITRLPDVPVHVEYFSSPEAVVQEKLELLKALVPDGTFIYNHDDERLNQVAKETRQPAIGYGRYLSTHFNADNDQIVYENGLPSGFAFEVSRLDDRAIVQVNGTIGLSSIYIYTAALAVASEFNISLTEGAKALAEHEPTPGRMRIFPGLKGTFIIDDTYNSSPTAVASALETLNELKGFKRKIAVLGDMMELGQFSSREHEEVGARVAKVADLLVTIGVRSRKMAEGALENGMSEKNILQYEYSDRAGRELQNLLEPGDVVLVKASQSVRAEKVVEEIMANPLEAEKVLVRQEESWKAR